MASGGNMRQFGAYVGESTAKTVTVGFQPRAVIVTNTDTGSRVEVDEFLARHETVAKRGGRKTNGADGVVSFLAVAAGITITTGGFTVGSDAACNSDGIQYTYEVTD